MYMVIQLSLKMPMRMIMDQTKEEVDRLELIQLSYLWEGIRKLPNLQRYKDM